MTVNNVIVSRGLAGQEVARFSALRLYISLRVFFVFSFESMMHNHVVDRLARTVGLKTGRGRYSRLDLSPPASPRNNGYLPGTLAKKFTLLIAISSIAILGVYLLVRHHASKIKRSHRH